MIKLCPLGSLVSLRQPNPVVGSSNLLLSKGKPFDWNPTGQTQEAFADRQRNRLLATQQERKKV